MNRQQVAAVARNLSRRAAAQQFSGAVLIRKGRVDLFCRAYGFANRSWKIKNDPHTRFRIASVGKLFTATAVLQLIDAGNLSLDTRVVEYLGLRDTRIPAEVTVYHLLTMTSGIADWINENAQDFNAEWSRFCREHPLYFLRSNADYLPIFSPLEPYSACGSRFYYSNAGFILLGLAIEKASGIRYFDYMREKVFAPAGMRHTDFLDLDDVSPRVAEGYVAVRDSEAALTGWRKNIYSTTAGGAGDGGETSTLHDLARFSQSLRAGRLLAKASVEAMLTPQVDAAVEGPGWTYGFGCFIVRGASGEIVRWGHTGEEDGVSCRLDYYPAQNLDVVVLGNQGDCAGRVAADIRDAIMGQS